MSSLSVTGGTSLQQLQTFLADNAGKDIRAKQDGDGNVTLYARSSWKPSARFLTKMGDMSGRTAKQDLARSTIKDIMTRSGLTPERANELVGMCKTADLKASSSGAKGIWIWGRGFNFPGMSRQTGVASMVEQAIEEAPTARLKGSPMTQQMQHPDLGPIIRRGCRDAYCPELSNCLDGLNGLPKHADECTDQEIIDFTDRFLRGNGADVVNDDLMGPNTQTTGKDGFLNQLDEWEAMPAGPEREKALQGLLDKLHTSLAKGVDSMIRQDVLRRVPDYGSFSLP
jgi:hypothetical protein